jgi:hypothetical protein
MKFKPNKYLVDLVRYASHLCCPSRRQNLTATLPIMIEPRDNLPEKSPTQVLGQDAMFFAVRMFSRHGRVEETTILFRLRHTVFQCFSVGGLPIVCPARRWTPPRQTGRAAFPHPAYRVTLVINQSRMRGDVPGISRRKDP